MDLDLAVSSAAVRGKVDGFASGCRYTAPIIAMPVYLGYLVERMKAAGGTLDIGAPVTSLRSLDAPLIVNCTGIGARDLVPDPAVVPLRGQVVIVANPGIEEFFRAPSDGPIPPTSSRTTTTWCWAARPTLAPGTWLPRPSITRRILRDCAAADPRLRGAQVLAERVGLRPYRPDVRLEAESLDDGRVLWHNYGHGGAGVTLAWACRPGTGQRCGGTRACGPAGLTGRSARPG